MIKGSQVKTELFQKIMEIFPNSFMYNNNKELRVNMTEEGTPIQIKVTLTVAKTPVEPTEGDIYETKIVQDTPTGELNWTELSQTIEEPTDEEKQRVAQLVKILNI